MPYLVKANGAGPWLQGQEVADEEFEKHPHHAKFLRTGSVVKVDAQARRDLNADQQRDRLAEIDQRIADLQAERAALVGTSAEPTAPAAVKYDIDRQDQPSGAEADANRAAGKEVVQPGPGNPVVGEVVPGEAADTESKRGRK
jgi:hypothetical protein